MPHNILLIQLGDIGDVVLTTPTIRAVKKHYPASRVSILVFRPYGSLLAADPNVHEIIENAKTCGSLLRRLRETAIFTRRLRQKHYDLVIDLRTGDRGAILSFLTGAPKRIGRQGVKKQFWHGILFTKIIRDLKVAPPPVHPGADQSLRVVRELGITAENSTPQLYIAPGDRQHVSAFLEEAGLIPGNEMVTINPFSRWKYKEWSNQKWGEVMDQIWEVHRIPSVLIGSSDESAACQGIIAGRSGRAFNLAGKTTLGELAALISMSSLHLGVDSAAPHIAAALGIPTLTIHGPSDWRGWRIVNDFHRIVAPERDCVPCNRRGCDDSEISRCLEELATAKMAEVAKQMLSLRIPRDSVTYSANILQQ